MNKELAAPKLIPKLNLNLRTSSVSGMDRVRILDEKAHCPTRIQAVRTFEARRARSRGARQNANSGLVYSLKPKTNNSQLNTHLSCREQSGFGNNSNHEEYGFSVFVFGPGLQKFSGQTTHLYDILGSLGDSTIEWGNQLLCFERDTIARTHHLYASDDRSAEKYLKMTFSNEHGFVTPDEIAIFRKFLGPDINVIPWARNMLEIGPLHQEAVRKIRERVECDWALASAMSVMDIDEKDGKKDCEMEQVQEEEQSEIEVEMGGMQEETLEEENSEMKEKGNAFSWGKSFDFGEESSSNPFNGSHPDMMPGDSGEDVEML